MGQVDTTQKFLLINNWCKIYNLQLLDIELCTNFVYQTNYNNWVTGWLLT